MYESQKDQIQQQSWNMEQAGMMQDNLKSPLFSYISILSAPLLLPRDQFFLSLAFIAVVMVVSNLLFSRGLLIRKHASPLGGSRTSVKTDVMVTVDALKTTNKELKKQYGKINIDKSRHSSSLTVNIKHTLMGGF
jgi:type III secretory pathway component EscR